MNILILRNVLIFTLLILGQPSFAQSTIDANLQKVLTEKRSKLNMSQLSKGTYFVRMTQNKKVFSQQIVIGK